MANVVRGMDGAMKSMDLEKVSHEDRRPVRVKEGWEEVKQENLNRVAGSLNRAGWTVATPSRLHLLEAPITAPTKNLLILVLPDINRHG